MGADGQGGKRAIEETDMGTYGHTSKQGDGMGTYGQGSAAPRQIAK